MCAADGSPSPELVLQPAPDPELLDEGSGIDEIDGCFEKATKVLKKCAEVEDIFLWIEINQKVARTVPGHLSVQAIALPCALPDPSGFQLPTANIQKQRLREALTFISDRVVESPTARNASCSASTVRALFRRSPQEIADAANA